MNIFGEGITRREFIVGSAVSVAVLPLAGAEARAPEKPSLAPRGALVLVQGRTTDEGRYLVYRAAATKTLLKYGGTPVVQAGRDKPSAVTALEGEVAEGVVILQFASKDAALAWYHSPEYTAARELRRDATEITMLVVETLT